MYTKTKNCKGPLGPLGIVLELVISPNNHHIKGPRLCFHQQGLPHSISYATTIGWGSGGA